VLRRHAAAAGQGVLQGNSFGEGCAYLCHESNVLYEH
jgi:hypothetical protein